MGIRSFAHRSFPHFTQIKWATGSDSLKTNERRWVNRSGCSEEMTMSYRERITQVAQDKWATMSDWLRSLRGNERMSNLLKKIWLKNLKSWFTMFYLRFLKKNVAKNERIAHFLFFGEQCKWIAHFAQIKWAMWAIQKGAAMSDSLTSLISSEQIAHGRSFSLTKNEWMSELLIFLSKALICSFLDKKRVIRLEIKWANSQSCIIE